MLSTVEYQNVYKNMSVDSVIYCLIFFFYKEEQLLGNLKRLYYIELYFTKYSTRNCVHIHKKI